MDQILVSIIHENVTHIVFIIVCEMDFLLVLSKCSIRTCQNVQGLHHLYGNNQVLKIAVDRVTLELCDSHDYMTLLAP